MESQSFLQLGTINFGSFGICGSECHIGGQSLLSFPDAAISPKVVLIAQNHLGDGTWVFVTNIIADYIGTDFPSYGYGLTLTKGFNEKWSGFRENQGYMSDFYSDAIVRGGAAYLIYDDLQIERFDKHQFERHTINTLWRHWIFLAL